MRASAGELAAESAIMPEKLRPRRKTRACVTPLMAVASLDEEDDDDEEDDAASPKGRAVDE